MTALLRSKDKWIVLIATSIAITLIALNVAIRSYVPPAPETKRTTAELPLELHIYGLQLNLKSFKNDSISKIDDVVQWDLMIEIKVADKSNIPNNWFEVDFVVRTDTNNTAANGVGYPFERLPELAEKNSRGLLFQFHKSEKPIELRVTVQPTDEDPVRREYIISLLQNGASK